MNNELNLKNSYTEYKVFLQDGFYLNTTLNPRVHKHNYAEVHLVSNGGLVFNVGEKKYEAKAGDMLIIPRRILHASSQIESGTRHTAFQISYDADEFSVIKLPQTLVSDFFVEIERCRENNIYDSIAAYVMLFISYVRKDKSFSSKRITDYGFLINEFFSHHYSDDIHIEDLAKELHLSERQTERLVVFHTGNTFGRELSATRISIARHLMKTTDMPLTDIAEYVGYRSYAGFFKALKRHGKQFS